MKITDQFTKSMKEGERLIEVIRRDLLAELPQLLLAAGFVLADFFLLWFFVRHAPWGIWAFVAVLIAGIIIGARAAVEWRMNVFVLTSQRILHVRQRGFFSRAVAEAALGKVTDVRYTVTGIIQTALSLGSVEVQTAGEGENMKLDGIRRPQAVQQRITDTLQQVKPNDGQPLSADELVAALTKAKRELGNDAWQRIVQGRTDQS